MCLDLEFGVVLFQKHFSKLKNCLPWMENYQFFMVKKWICPRGLNPFISFKCPFEFCQSQALSTRNSAWMLGLDQDRRVEWAGRAFDSYHVWWSCGAPAGYGRTARPHAVYPSDPSPPPRLPQTWSNVPSLSSASPGSYPLSARWAPQTPMVITMSKAHHKALLKNHNQSCFKAIPCSSYRQTSTALLEGEQNWNIWQ